MELENQNLKESNKSHSKNNSQFTQSNQFNNINNFSQDHANYISNISNSNSVSNVNFSFDKNFGEKQNTLQIPIENKINHIQAKPIQDYVSKDLNSVST